jgi:hypothetical protein
MYGGSVYPAFELNLDRCDLSFLEWRRAGRADAVAGIPSMVVVGTVEVVDSGSSFLIVSLSVASIFTYCRK